MYIMLYLRYLIYKISLNRLIYFLSSLIKLVKYIFVYHGHIESFLTMT